MVDTTGSYGNHSSRINKHKFCNAHKEHPLLLQVQPWVKHFGSIIGSKIYQVLLSNCPLLGGFTVGCLTGPTPTVTSCELVGIDIFAQCEKSHSPGLCMCDCTTIEMITQVI